MDLKTQFSPRQNEILYNLSRGLSNEEIAKEMKITLSTVAFHFHILFIKTDTNTRNQLLVKYLQQKFY
jgi:DNA-binding NarL/FixJ family response regulator